jgi:peptidoglycan/LPS O-acetylase OafA/YrhL
VLPLGSGVVTKLLDVRWLAKLGVISYGIYLWHAPAGKFITTHTSWPQTYLELMPVVMVASIGLAALSYRFVEEPFLRRRRAWTDPLTTPAGDGKPS